MSQSDIEKIPVDSGSLIIPPPMPSVDEISSDVDGLDTTPPEIGHYPIDSLMIRTDKRTVFDIHRRIEQGVYILDPDFQRDFIWDERKQSKLIESAIMRIPLPVFYLAEMDDGKIVVVDGLQRLSTFKHFLEGDGSFDSDKKLKGLKLKGLTHAKEYEGKYFKDLPSKIKNRIEDTSLTLYLIDAKVSDQAKIDIFERVNGGVPLTPQQMRNCLYLSDVTRWLGKMAKTAEFLDATDSGLNIKRMRDRECINRFLGFYKLDAEEHYTGNMEVFLNTTLKELKGLSEADLEDLSQRFLKSMRINYAIFEKNAFRKNSKNNRRTVINVSLFDVFSVIFAKDDYSEAELIMKKDRLLRGYNELLDNETFFTAISVGTNAKHCVIDRFSLAEDMIKRVMNNA